LDKSNIGVFNFPAKVVLKSMSVYLPMRLYVCNIGRTSCCTDFIKFGNGKIYIYCEIIKNPQVQNVTESV
jgi:hypothetical protein